MSAFGVSYVAGGRFDPPFMPTKPDPYMEGLQIEVPGMVDFFEASWTVPFDCELVSVAADASMYQVRDYWTLKINGKAKLNKIYTKSAGSEEVYLMAIIPLTAGDVIEFTFFNGGGHSKFASFNIQVLKDEEVTP